jgi:hypothetical protein
MGKIMLNANAWLQAAAVAEHLQKSDLRVKSVEIVACMHENRDVLAVVPTFHPAAANSDEY